MENTALDIDIFREFLSLLPLEIILSLIVLIIIIKNWEKIKRIIRDIISWFYFVLLLCHSKLRNYILKKWCTERWEKGYFKVYFDNFLIIKEKLRMEDFIDEFDRKRGFVTYRKDNMVVAEIFYRRYNSDTKSNAYFECLEKASNWNEAAKQFEYKDLEILFRCLNFKDLAAVLKKKADRVAIEDKIEKQEWNKKSKRQFKKILITYETSLKDRNLSELDELLKFVFLKAMKKCLKSV